MQKSLSDKQKRLQYILTVFSDIRTKAKRRAYSNVHPQNPLVFAPSLSGWVKDNTSTAFIRPIDCVPLQLPSECHKHDQAQDQTKDPKTHPMFLSFIFKNTQPQI